MPRFKCTLEYDGTPYAGWQWQDDQPSAQGALEAAIRAFTQEQVRVQCAGRTDAGVHATGQVVHFDITKPRTTHQVAEGLNFYLIQADETVRVLACEQVNDDFHARFSAIERRYLYRLINRRAPLALDVGRAWHVGWPLDVDAMREAAALLLGKHDFTSLRATSCQAQSPVKTLDRLDIEAHGDEIRFYVEARSFLHHQVRNIVGTLEAVGSGKFLAQDIPNILAAKNRSAAGQTAPACGLYLVGVGYD
jgi:tRNA pseudouridine38-40 synthase